MNNFLHRCIFVEQSRILCVLKKCAAGNLLLRNSASPFSTFNISTRYLSISSKQHVSFVYTVTLKTGDKLGAGTDSNVYLRMIGELGSTDEIILPSVKEDLERGRVDQYNFPSDYVGPLKKIIIRHDSTGFAPGWFLDWISIQDGKGKKYNFECNQWLIKEEGYGNIKLLKEVNYVEKDPIEKVTSAESQAIDDLVKSNQLDNEILQDLKGLEDLATSFTAVKNNDEVMDDVIMTPKGVTETETGTMENVKITVANEAAVYTNTMDDHFASNSVPVDAPQSTRHATSLSPAVRNLVDTYGIDMFKVPASGRDSRLLKGDVLAYMEKENITQKKFVVSMLHPTTISEDVDEKQSAHVDSISLVGDNYLDHMISTDEQSLARQLTLSKFEVPHLYMSTGCHIDRFNTFIQDLDEEASDKMKSTLLVRILSQSLLDVNLIPLSANNEEVVDILLSHNGSSSVIRNCSDANIENIYRQYGDSKDTIDALTLPRFGVNIVDTDGVSQLSSILRIGQVISLNISGTKLGVDTNGKIVKSVTMAISCDSRVIPEVTCALLLLSCKNYLSNPNLLGLK